MLTKQQIKKLTPLTKDPKFGKLLKFAISGWKKTKPVCKRFGLKLSDKRHFVRRREYQGCCLIGAALLYKKSKAVYANKWDYDLEVCIRFPDIRSEEVSELINGFDNDNVENPSEAYKFANKVRNIVKPEVAKSL